MDISGMDQIEEEEFNNQPTIEVVKKIVDSRRQKDKFKRFTVRVFPLVSPLLVLSLLPLLVLVFLTG